MKLNLIGETFGLLTVTKECSSRRYPKKVDWVCVCICGTIVTRHTQQLTKFNDKCGCRCCVSKRNMKKVFEQNEGYPPNYYTDRKQAALLKKANEIRCRTEHGMSFSKEEVLSIISLPCFYCGAENTETQLNGIDRIDSTKEYRTDNVVSCCWTCNKMKSTLSIEDFYGHIEKIINNKTH